MRAIIIGAGRERDAIGWLMALLVVCLCALPGCATKEPDPRVARKKAYERLASLIEPGMTRRQLYALLPPQRTPTYHVSEYWRESPNRHREFRVGPCEEHQLDPDYYLRVRYAIPQSHRRPLDLDSMTPEALCDFFFGRRVATKKPVPSKQNLDDRLRYRPRVFSDKNRQL